MTNNATIHWVRITAYLLMVMSACASILFVAALKPSDIITFAIISLWLTVPYAIMSAGLKYMECHNNIRMHGYWIAMITSLFGILFLTDVVCWHPDAQGAIAVLMTPGLQGIVLMLLIPLARWISSRHV